MGESYISGLVLFTVSNDELRDSLRLLIKDELGGEEINESSYSLPKTGDFSAKSRLTKFFQNNKESFSETDFIRVCYSAALVTQKNKSHKDDIIVFKIA